jgi:hypothetical protein
MRVKCKLTKLFLVLCVTLVVVVVVVVAGSARQKLDWILAINCKVVSDS